MKYYHSYVCGYNNNHKGCCHKNAVKTERIDIPVIETLRAYIQKKEFMLAVKEQLEKQVDISSIEKEIAGCKKEQEKLQARESQQYSILEKIGYDEKYKNVKEDRILDAINRIAEESSAVQEKLLAKEKALTAAKNNSLTMEKIQYAIENFAVVFQSASKDLQNELIQHFVDEIRLERDSENGKLYPKSMVIKFTGEEIDLVVENLGVKKSHVETVVLLSRETNPLTVEVRMEVETGEVKEHPTYKRIQEYVQEKYGFKVHTAYIAEVKRMVGLDMHKAPNAVEQRKHEYHPCPPEKVEAIKDALRHFGLIAE